MNDTHTISKHFAALTSLMVQGHNEEWTDDQKIDAIAKYVVDHHTDETLEYIDIDDHGTLPNAVYEAIQEYGEPIDETYMGRDAEGEKQYHCFNPTTAWTPRIWASIQRLVPNAWDIRSLVLVRYACV